MTDKWQTPSWLMRVFDGWFDPCPISYKEGDISGLSIEWKDKTYVNPPYSDPLPWIEKAIQEYRQGKTIVLVLKIDNSTKWYRELVSVGAHILLFNERLKFSDSDTAPFPSMMAILSESDMDFPIKQNRL